MITGEFVELACKDRSCAPPPVGTGGSRPSTGSVPTAADVIDKRSASLLSPKLGLPVRSLVEVSTEEAVDSVMAQGIVKRAAYAQIGEQLKGKIDWKTDINDPSVLWSADFFMMGHHYGKGDPKALGDMEAFSLRMRAAYENGKFDEMAEMFYEETGSRLESVMVAHLNAQWVEANHYYDTPRHMTAVTGNVLADRMNGESVPSDNTGSYMSDRAMGVIVKQVYENTQQRLRERGVKEVTLLRGVPTVTTKGNVMIPEDGEVEVQLRALSPYTTSSKIARSFAGSVLVTRVPAEQVFSVADSGIGSFGEGEVVVLGGTYPSLVLTGDDLDVAQSFVDA